MARVALIQVRIDDAEPIQDRISRVLDMVRDQHGKCDFAILPELWTVGAFDTAGYASSAAPTSGAFIQRCSAVAAETNIWLHAGSFIEQDQHELFNTAAVFDPNGDVVTFYRKRHLFGFQSGEAAVLSPGQPIVVIADTPVGDVGLSTCYDLRFPEQYRYMVDLDVQTHLVSASWPSARLNHWRILNQARAIENQTWVLACNSTGVSAGIELAGHSMVIDPKGEIVAEADGDQTVLYAEVDLELLNTWRHDFPVLDDRLLD